MCPRGSVLDTPVDADFALKAQTYYDKYVESCSTGRIEGDYYCKSRRKATVEGTPFADPGLGSIIYDCDGRVKREDRQAGAVSMRVQ